MDLSFIDVPLWAILLIFILATSYIYYTWTFGVIKQLGLAGPKPIPVLGNMHTMIKMGIRNFDREMMKEYGKIFGIYEGRDPVIVAGDPDIIKAVMVKNFSNFVNHGNFPLRGIMKHSLFDAKDERWKHIRDAFSPAFTSGKLKRMVPLISNAAENFVRNVANSSNDIDAKDVCVAFTMDVNASTGFGIQLDSQNDPNHPFLVNTKKHFKMKLMGMFGLMKYLNPLFIPILEWFNFTTISGDAIEFFTKVVTRALHDRKTNREEQRVDFLQLMVQAEQTTPDDPADIGQQNGSVKKHNKPALTKNEVIACSYQFLAAGSEGTSSTLAFLLYNLAVNHEIQDKLITEVDQHIPTKEDINYESVNKLSYLDQCMEETLRLYPTVPRVERMASQDIEIKGVKIPAGTLVVVPMAAIHLDPEVWPDPEKFDPDRFSPEVKAARHPYCYLPFGLGPRNCVGKRLGELEIKIAMATLLKQFKFEKSEETQVPLKLENNYFMITANINIRAVPRTENNK